MKKYYEPDKVNREIPKEPIPQEVRTSYLRPGELLAIQESFPVAFLPLGTLEWHGRHNPLGCDAIKAENLCIRTAQIAGGAVMPPIHFAADTYRDNFYGVGLGMDTTAGFQLPGSFYQIDTDLLKRLLVNACTNYLNRGFRLVVMVSGHNPAIQQHLMDEVCYLMKTPDGKEPVAFTMEYTVIEPDHPRRTSDHAAGYETSMMLYLCGDRVNRSANDRQERPDLGVMGTIAVGEASAEEGRIRMELQVEGLVRFARSKLDRLLQST